MAKINRDIEMPDLILFTFLYEAEYTWQRYKKGMGEEYSLILKQQFLGGRTIYSKAPLDCFGMLSRKQ